MIDVSVEVKGIEAPRLWLMTAPVALLRDIHDTLHEAGPLLSRAVSANTDVDTGTLLSSEQLSIRDGAFGGSVRVWSELRYTRYVEHGTTEHGAAQFMFLRGVMVTRPTIERLFDYNIRRTVR